jgi:GxxExxY protein
MARGLQRSPPMNVDRSPVTDAIIAAAIKVHDTLGPGLLESVYEKCLAHELSKRGLRVESQSPLPVEYDGVRLDCGYRLDLLVERQVIIEVKSVERLLPIHTAQVITYLKLSGVRQALLLNFNAPTLTGGMKSLLGPEPTPPW